MEDIITPKSARSEPDGLVEGTNKVTLPTSGTLTVTFVFGEPKKIDILELIGKPDSFDKSTFTVRLGNENGPLQNYPAGDVNTKQVGYFLFKLSTYKG